jgi:hypothetical protein
LALGTRKGGAARLFLTSLVIHVNLSPLQVTFAERTSWLISYELREERPNHPHKNHYYENWTGDRTHHLFQILIELEAVDEFVGDGGDAGESGLGKIATARGMRVAYYDPKPGAVRFIIAGANRASELGNLKAGPTQQFRQDTAGIIDEVAESLRDQDDVHVPRSGLLELVKVVIRKRLFERNLDGR